MADIKLFRKDNNLSQVELAEIIGCTQGFISSLEKKRRPIPSDIISKLISLEKYNTRHLINAQEASKEKVEANDEVTMSREVFDVLKNLSETVLSQQRTIEQIQIDRKKIHVRQEDNAECADASGSDLVK